VAVVLFEQPRYVENFSVERLVFGAHDCRASRTQTFIKATSAGISVVFGAAEFGDHGHAVALLSGAPPSGVTKIKSSVKFGSPGFDVVGQYGSFYGLHMETTSCSAGVSACRGPSCGIFAGDGSAVAGSAKPLRFSGSFPLWCGFLIDEQLPGLRTLDQTRTKRTDAFCEGCDGFRGSGPPGRRPITFYVGIRVGRGEGSAEEPQSLSESCRSGQSR